MSATIPSDVLLAHVLPRCSIDVRLAFGVPPRRLDTRLYETLKRRFPPRDVYTTDNSVRITIPNFGRVKYEYDSEHTISVPGSIYVVVRSGESGLTRFWITADGRVQYTPRPRIVDTIPDDIPRFDPSTLPRNAKIAIVGIRGRGKTNLAMDLVRGREVSLVVAGRDRRTGYMPFERFPNVRSDLVEVHGPGAVVLEDGEYAWNLKRNARFHELMYDQGRTVITCMQGPYRHSEYFDHYFVFNAPGPSQRKWLWARFMRDRFESKAAFETALNRCAPDYHDCMVVADGRLWTYRAPRLRFGDGDSIVPWDSDEPGPP